MAQQIKVNSSTGNIQIQISRGAIGPSTTANVANTALNLNAASTANVIIGGGVANYVLSTDGAGNTSWVAQTGGGTPGGANTQVQFNDEGSFGAEANFTYNKATDVLTADHFSGEGGNLSNIQGANVSGEVSFAATANAVALANVAGAGNIASVNLDGNVANVLRGDGTFSPDTAATPGGSNTQVQYNDNGSFAGEANFTYDSATGNLTAPNIIASTQFTGDINGAILVEVYNASGGTLNKGDIVALNGAAHGSTPDVVKADSGNASLMPGFAVVKEGISSTAVGEAVISGKMNFSSHGFTIGAQLYVDGTGTFTETRPSGENQLVQKIATVTNSNTLNIAGAGRTNDIPNLNEGNIFLGNASNVGATTNLNSAINTHLAAFGSNTITTTGLITGDGGGLSNIAGGNVSGSVANAVYADTAGFAGSSPPAGSNTQVQFNDADVLGADANFTYNKSTPALSVGYTGDGQLLSSQVALNKTLTSNTYLLSTVATLNNASDMTLWKANVTDTLSGANTKLIDMIVDSNSMMTLSKTGDHTIAGQSQADSFYSAYANGNITIGPDTSVFGVPSGAIFVDNGYNSPETLNQAFITSDFANTPFGGTGEAKYITYAEDGGNIAQGGSIEFLNFGDAGTGIGNSFTDPWVPGYVTFKAIPFTGNLADPSGSTFTSIQMSSASAGGGGFLTIIGDENTDDFNRGAWKQFQYRPIAMEFQRRGGNGQVRTGVQAGDITAIDFNFASNEAGNVGSNFFSYGTRFAAKVDSSFGGNPFETAPSGFEYQIVAANTIAGDRLYHNMYANGDVQFNTSKQDYLGNPISTNPVTVGQDGTITATNYVTLGNETVANLTSNTPVVAGVAGAMISVSDADYQPAHWSVADNVWKYVSNRANV
jgi:hypothetical protein